LQLHLSIPFHRDAIEAIESEISILDISHSISLWRRVFNSIVVEKKLLGF
jgi:hypothetical protein